jgi:phosphonate transport system substrate-binding protein
MTKPVPDSGMTNATRLSRRVLLAVAASFAAPAVLRASQGLRLGITPVFLDNDAAILGALQGALSTSLGTEVSFQQRRTYEEVTGLLLEGAVDAAWLCGYPYLQHRERLQIVAVPVWNGQPLYQSYLIAHEDDAAASLEDLRGSVHAFSDPDSNSGFLVTASDLAETGERPDGFFSRVIFTYGHRNVVRAVSDGLVRSGSVDGYVWESLSVVEPDLVARTRIVSRSEWLGFPPFCARLDGTASASVRDLGDALIRLDQTETGRAALRALLLDGMTRGTPDLFDGIARRMQNLAALR